MRSRFDCFEFAHETLELFKDGQRVRLQRQPALVLRQLIDHAGELVTREDLRDAVWGDDRHVDVDRSLAYCLRQIRVALDDDPANPRYVETLRGLGFRFVGPIPSQATVTPTNSPRVRLDWRFVTAAACLLVVAGATVLVGPGWRQNAALARADEFIDRGERGSVEDVKVALAVYNRVLSTSPSSSTTLARALAGAAAAESMLANHHRDLQAAQAALLKAVEAARLAPTNPDVLTAYAHSLKGAGRLDEAADTYGAAIAAAPDRTILLTHLASVEFQRGRFDTAVQLLHQQWTLGPPDAGSADLLATVLTQLGFEARAHEWSALALDLLPEHRQPGFLKALNAYRAGRLDEAEDILVPLLSEPDPGAQVVSLGAQVVARRRGVDAVLPRLVAAAATFPEANNVRTLLADAYRAVGRPDDERRERARVMEICQKGATLAPSSPLWARCLASQFVLADDLDTAVFWYGRAVDLGWRQLQIDRADGWLAMADDDPRVQAIQTSIRTELDRMRAAVLQNGLPEALMPH